MALCSFKLRRSGRKQPENEWMQRLQWQKKKERNFFKEWNSTTQTQRSGHKKQYSQELPLCGRNLLKRYPIVSKQLSQHMDSRIVFGASDPHQTKVFTRKQSSLWLYTSFQWLLDVRVLFLTPIRKISSVDHPLNFWVLKAKDTSIQTLIQFLRVHTFSRWR